MTTYNAHVFLTTAKQIFNLTQDDKKPLYGILSKLVEEVGELAEAVSFVEGNTTKPMKEPLVGEIADVIQCAMAVFAKSTPNLTTEQRLDEIVRWLSTKTNKWASQVQAQKEAEEAASRKKITEAQAKQVREATLNLQNMVARQRLGRQSIIDAVTQPNNQKIDVIKHSGTVTQPTQTSKTGDRVKSIFVQIRKHPSGLNQPTGERKVYLMREGKRHDVNMLQVGIGPDGKQGWEFDMSKPTPSWITFRLGSKGAPLTLISANEYWKKHLNTQV